CSVCAPGRWPRHFSADRLPCQESVPIAQAITDRRATNRAATECCGAGEGTAVSLSRADRRRGQAPSDVRAVTIGSVFGKQSAAPIAVRTFTARTRLGTLP